MTFHFQCDLSPALTNAGVSRFLITTIPSTLYIYDEEGTNLTLQAAACCITESLNKLARDGVVIRDRIGEEVCRLRGFVMNFKGDWKYLAQMFNMTKTAQQEEICWKCGATKGTNDPDMCYVNLSPTAPWRAVHGPGWRVRPSFADLASGRICFEDTMIGGDLLHIWHLGVGRDAIGSIVRQLVKERYWPGSNIERRLAFATASLKQWCKHRSMSLTIKRLSKQNLTWGSECFGLVLAPSFVCCLS
ncbi:Uncharacterized protein SCF082_LOCUS10582 [Durusdinium trenchii]|uniref:Uncharacterized protein n=1 Tax=Durusdinium trenchii TaxID=1381693 RepID=A0ABP0J7E6_9DINO